MQIIPDSKIKFYRGVPFDSNNTVMFADINAQNNYFHGTPSILKYTLDAGSYQRVNKGSMKVGFKADDLYDCNYLAFQNTSFGTKWFYAFIKEVEYVSNTVSMVTYEIDDMQTYLFDMKLNQCFVEREHSRTDTIGDNIVPEPVDLGEMVFQEYEQIPATKGMRVIVAICDTSGEAVNGKTYDGIYGGCQLFVFEASDSDGLNTFLSEYLAKPDSVVSMYMIPTFVFPGVIPDSHIVEGTFRSNYIDASFGGCGTTIDGFSPRNKKLFTYPYNYFVLDNANGSNLALRYEFFDGGQVKIRIMGTLLQPVEVVAYPCAYKGAGRADEGIGGWSPMTAESITVTGFPNCSWNTDSYKQWVAQNAIPTGIAAVAGGVIGLATGNPLGVAAGLGGVASLLTQQYKASIQADVCRGSFSNGNVNASWDMLGLFKSRVSVNRLTGRIIDDFFTMYGYATNKVKVPNTSARPYWTYVKTNGCSIEGSIPASSIKNMESIFDRGIRFWTSPNNVGNYGLNNSPS